MVKREGLARAQDGKQCLLYDFGQMSSQSHVKVVFSKRGISLSKYLSLSFRSGQLGKLRKLFGFSITGSTDKLYPL